MNGNSHSTLGFMVPYGYVRARQLEGTYPGPKETGAWGINFQRVMYGWGDLTEDDWPDRTGWPFEEIPNADQRAKPLRGGAYFRVTSAFEAQATLRQNMPVAASFEITSDWLVAKLGLIPFPPESIETIGSHAVLIDDCRDDLQRFQFRNSWGFWGDMGRGYMPYDYFDARLLEAFGLPGISRSFTRCYSDNPIQWNRRRRVDFLQRSSYVFDVYDESADELMAWTFVVQHRECLAVEELYVRPNFRRRGYGRRLFETLLELSDRVNLPLQFWIPFADYRSIDDFKPLLYGRGFRLEPSNIRSVALVANPGKPESDVPQVHLPKPPAYAPSKKDVDTEIVKDAASIIPGHAWSRFAGTLTPDDPNIVEWLGILKEQQAE